MTLRFRHMVELLAPASAADDAGGVDRGFETVESVWAGLERLPTVREPGARRRRIRRLAATVRIRSDVREGWALRVDGADYEIVSIEAPDGPERRLTLICEELPL